MFMHVVAVAEKSSHVSQQLIIQCTIVSVICPPSFPFTCCTRLAAYAVQFSPIFPFFTRISLTNSSHFLCTCHASRHLFRKGRLQCIQNWQIDEMTCIHIIIYIHIYIYVYIYIFIYICMSFGFHNLHSPILAYILPYTLSMEFPNKNHIHFQILF